MKNVLYLIILFYSINSIAQSSKPIVFTLDTSEYQLSIENLDFIQENDTLDGLRLREIVSDRFSTLFQKYDSSKLNFNDDNYIWFRFQIENGTSHKIKLAIKKVGEKYTVFLKRNSNLIDTLKPTLKYYYNDPIHRENKVNVMAFDLDTNESCKGYIYVSSVDFKKEIQNKILIGSFLQYTIEGLKSREFNIKNRMVYNSAISGFLFFGSLLLFIFYLVTKYKPYLYAFLIIGLLSSGVVTSEYSMTIKTNVELYGILIGLSYFTFIFFYLRNLFESFIYLTSIDKVMKVITLFFVPIVFIICFIVIIVVNKYFKSADDNKLITGTLGSIGILYLSGLISIPVLLRKIKRKEFYFFLIAFVPLFLIEFIIPMIEQYITGNNYLTEKYDWISNLIYIWTALILTFEVINRYRIQASTLLLTTNENQKLMIEKAKEINAIINSKNIELEETVRKRTEDLTNSLNSLKETQTRLIQTEKLAHLGQLTAGVAHEIQNPLNFINNFAELNRELSEELLTQVNSERSVTEVQSTIENISNNSEKICYHGKRADSIVKSMLQHVRSENTKYLLSDINSLFDECWRLSYHGFRAKDKLFSVKVNFDFDMSISKIKINPEDMSRVFINLINNALYALYARWNKRINDLTYQPSLELITREQGGDISIIVKDNGTGIPEHIKSEIYNPFFTTKPTGEGIGLGLSLVYDIITKGHKGKIDFESMEGEGTTFYISIPFTI